MDWYRKINLNLKSYIKSYPTLINLVKALSTILMVISFICDLNEGLNVLNLENLFLITVILYLFIGLITNSMFLHPNSLSVKCYPLTQTIFHGLYLYIFRYLDLYNPKNLFLSAHSTLPYRTSWQIRNCFSVPPQPFNSSLLYNIINDDY